MNREKFCATPQYQKWRRELEKQKLILKKLNDIPDILNCEYKINKLKKLMKLI